MKNNSGFTLMELMTVIAIIGIVSAIAVPNMISWRANHQLNGSAREVMSVLNGARVAAVKNNAMVTVNVDTAAKEITTSFVNRAGAVGDPPTTAITPLNPGIKIDSVDFSGSNVFRFNSRGLPIKVADTSFASGKVTISNSRGDRLEVIMASTGISHIDKP